MLWLSWAEMYLLVVIAGALVLFLSNRLPPDLVALLVLLALGLSGLVSPAQVIAGFGSPAVVTILGLFIITATLERTGVVAWLSERLARIAGGSESGLIGV
ncbi:MAG: SLC13 family permease, partial [Blastochloris sp.]|nr:SLC13 family permease [Blastochloris sp.]